MAKVDVVTVDGVYDEDHLRHNIIQPNKIFRITHFFIDHWLPLLGPKTAWLVVSLQQSYWQKQRGKIAQSTLGRLSGLSRNWVSLTLRDVKYALEGEAPKRMDEQKAALLTYFIRRITTTTQTGRGQGVNRYQVVLNDPLTPMVAQRLRAELSGLREQIASSHSDQAAQEAVKRILADDALLTGIRESRGEISNGALLSPCTVREIVANVFNLDDVNHPLIELSEKLSRQILRPKQAYLGTQYFRRKWVPELGALRAWLIILARRHTYHNPQTGERRDTFTINRADAARQLGVSERTFRRLLNTMAPDPFFLSVEAKKTLYIKVAFPEDEPLLLDDQRRLEAQNRAAWTKINTGSLKLGQKSTPAFPKSGQKSTPAPSSLDKNQHRLPQAWTKINTGSSKLGQKSTPAP